MNYCIVRYICLRFKRKKILKAVVRRIFRQNEQQFQNRDNVYRVIFLAIDNPSISILYHERMKALETLL